MPDEFRTDQGDVPWREIAGLRDILVHHYFGISDETIWSIARGDIAELAKQLGAWIPAEHERD